MILQCLNTSTCTSILNLSHRKFVNQCNIFALQHNIWVYMEIQNIMPGLKQAGIITNDHLREHLAPFGYHPVPRTPTLWQHEFCPIFFELIVDYFCV